MNNPPVLQQFKQQQQPMQQTGGSAQPLIVVAGATGKQGGSVIRNLLSNNAQWRIRGLCRDTENDSAKKLKKEFPQVELVSCNLNDLDSVNKALAGSYGVFGVTNYWQEEIMKNQRREFNQGKNLVDAAIANQVKHFIWSTLDNADSLTRGQHKVWHFTMKALVEEYAIKTVKPQHQLKLTFAYPAFYYSNLCQMYHVIDDSNGKKVVVLTGSINEDVKLPMFDEHEMGIPIARLFLENWQKLKSQFNPIDANSTIERMLIAGDELTMPQIAAKMQQEWNKGGDKKIEVLYEHLVEREAEKKYGFEMVDMYGYFNHIKGYYSRNQHAAVEECKRFSSGMSKASPAMASQKPNEQSKGMTDFSSWFAKNKSHFTL